MAVAKTFTYIPPQHDPVWKAIPYIPVRTRRVLVAFKAHTYEVWWETSPSRRHDEEHRCAMINLIDGDWHTAEYSEDFLGGSIEECIEYLVTEVHENEIPIITASKAKKQS